MTSQITVTSLKQPAHTNMQGRYLLLIYRQWKVSV